MGNNSVTTQLKLFLTRPENYIAFNELTLRGDYLKIEQSFGEIILLFTSIL